MRNKENKVMKKKKNKSRRKVVRKEKKLAEKEEQKKKKKNPRENKAEQTITSEPTLMGRSIGAHPSAS